MNINSLYSQYNSLNNAYKIPNKSNIFKDIKLNNYLNKTENFSTKKNSPKNNLNLIPLKSKIINNNVKKANYDELISKLKSEFKTIEKTSGKEFLSLTQHLQKNNQYINNRYSNNLNIHLLKTTHNSVNLKNKIKYVEDIILSTDKALLNRDKNINKKSKDKNSSKHIKNNQNKMKYSSDLKSNKIFKKEESNDNFKIVNFNDVYDNLIGKGNSREKREKMHYKSENPSQNILQNFKDMISNDKIRKLNKSKNEKKPRNYYKCNLFQNLNKMTFDRKPNKKSTPKNKYKICKNISFSYNNSKFDKYNDYFKYDKNALDDCNFNIIKSLNILKEIVNIQSKIIIQFKKKEENLQKEIIIKKNEINTYKSVCLKFIYYIKSENIYFLNNYKKYILIQSQLIKENEILRDIILSNKLYLFKMEENKDNKENFFYLFFERQNKSKNNILLNKNKRTNSKQKKDLINQMLSRDKIFDNPFYVIRNNSYDYFKNNPYKIEKKAEKKIINNKNNYKKKKICYLYKNRK